jgi:hypothetical protein
MRSSGWTPSIVPNGEDQAVYLVKDDLGRLGAVWREADAEATDLETVITDLLTGQYHDPVRVISFNTVERWSQDVSEDVAHELRRRCDLQMRDVPSGLRDFVERHEGHAWRSCAWSEHAVPTKEAGGNRHQGALPRLRRASAGDLNREGAER